MRTLDATLVYYIVLVFVAVLVVVYFYQEKYVRPVYCVMITGKDAERTRLARNATKNFLQQTYKKKHLVIINHGEELVLDRDLRKKKNIREVTIFKGPNTTLGDMRNIAFKYIPEGAVFCVWDDDDWRRKDYLSTLMNTMNRHRANAVTIKNRIEFNKNTGAVWTSTLEDGFYWYFMVKDPRFLYASLDTGEDGVIRKNLIKMREKNPKFYYVLDNDPALYLRFIHDNNTSRYVLSNQAKPRNFVRTSQYQEREATQAESEYARDIYKKYG